MGRRFWLGGVVVVGAAAALLLGQAFAFASGVYASGEVGYDISYPQCGTAYPIGQFGIVGVNKGYPFTYYNPCFSGSGGEWPYAQSTPDSSLYINTGYDPSYTKVDSNHSTQDCVNKSTSISGTSSQQLAWGVGCSEAERSVAYASCGSNVPGSCATTVQPAAWWLDIETANSWCGRPGTHCRDLTLNQYTIQGIIDTLHTLTENPTSAPVGIYSTSNAWTKIVGGNPVNNIAADWLATGASSESEAMIDCSGTGFTGPNTAIWLVQYVPGSTDVDYSC